MPGLFSLLSLLIGVVYPIFGSYKTFEMYQKSAIAASTGSVNVGGINVPIVSMLKKATSSGSASKDHVFDEDLLQLNLLTTQKWLIYWIVYASYSLVETILLFKSVIPFYSFIKTGLLVWLLAPLLTSAVVKKEASVEEIQKSWLAFQESGCGLVYYQYLKPLFNSELQVLDKLDIKSLSQYALLATNVNPISFVSSYLAGGSNGNTDSKNGGSWTQYAMNTFQLGNLYSRGPTPEGEQKKELETEDFDIIDKPKDEEGGAKNRGKKGWLW